MENILIKAAESVPNLVIMLAIVWLFIRFLERQSSAAATRDAAQAAILAALNAQNVAAAKEAHGVILANTMANTANTNQLSANTSAINEMTKSMRALIEAQKHRPQ